MNAAIKAAQINRSAEISRAALESLKSALDNPIFAGLTALAINQILYKAGFYDPRLVYDPGTGEPAVPQRSILGGPVWFSIGNPAPDTPESVGSGNATVIGLWIMACATAWAASSKVTAL